MPGLASRVAASEIRLLRNRYELKARVGEGGLAWVYAAKDHSNGSTVAVKILRPEVIRANPETVQRFEGEAELLRNLSHPHIVRCFDYGQEFGLYFIVLELIEGFTLRDVVTQSGAMPVGRALSVARQIADALSHTEALRIVHRDIKPHNIIVDRFDWAKLMDFGIARVHSISHMTATGRILGTPQYLSPEQAEGRQVDITTDIYSLGLTMYEAISGAPLFSGETPAEIISKVLNPPRPKLKVLEASLSDNMVAQVEEIVARCLARDRRDRYQSPQELVGVLDAFLTQVAEQNSPVRSPLDNLLGYVQEQATPTAPVNRVSAHLTVAGNRGGLPPRVFEVGSSEIRIGRTDQVKKIFPNVDLTLENPDLTVHRRHLRIKYERGGWYALAEVGAEQDTVIDGRKMQMDSWVKLNDGSRIVLSKAVELRFDVQK